MPSPRRQKDKVVKAILAAVKKYPAVKLAYLFGSRAAGNHGTTSDYDIAIYADGLDKKKRFDLKLKLIADLSRLLKTDAIDLVMLNDAQSPELKYNIIRNGILVCDREPFRVILEPRILNEYFDFRQSLLKYNLTSA